MATQFVSWNLKIHFESTLYHNKVKYNKTICQNENNVPTKQD